MVLPIINNMKIESAQIISAMEDKNVICWSDLLEKLNLITYFKQYKEKNNGESYSIQKVFMGKTLINKLDETFKSRIVKTKDRRIKHLKKRWRLAEYGLDCLQSMPTESKEDIDYMLLKDL